MIPGLKSIFLILLFMAGIMVSCDEKGVYDTYHHLPESVWQADSLMVYEFTIENTRQQHNLYFNIRNDRSYAFSNLWLFVSITSPGGTILTDTMQVVLADPSGKWLGKGFTGIYHNKVTYRSNIFFPEEGKCSLILQHGMRPKELSGITDIGVRLEKSGS